TNSAFTAGVIDRIYGRTAAVLYHGVDTRVFCPKTEGTSRGDYCLSVGALAPLKGHDLVIDALSRLPARERPRLIIVADRLHGEETPRLEARALAGGVRLDIRLRVTDEELARLYRGARLTLYAPIREPFGLVPL